MTVLDTSNVAYMDKQLFLDKSLGIQRYDVVRYPQIAKAGEKIRGFMWTPNEIDLTKDISDFKTLSPHEEHIFTSNLKRQILLDSVQGRSPNLAFLPIATNPELEETISWWAADETLHSRSYTHIIRSVYSDPSKVFDSIFSVSEIVDCAKDITKYYDDLIKHNTFMAMRNYGFDSFGYSVYEHKKSIYRALMSVNALEGLRFYVSFGASWNFAENGKMEGNAKIIKLICRDENVHLAFTQQQLEILRKDDPDFAKIHEELHDEMVAMYIDVANQEKMWAKYLFKDGSLLGLNEHMLQGYVDYLLKNRLRGAGLNSKDIPNVKNPLPWISNWISGDAVQNAPQETEVDDYQIGVVNTNTHRKYVY